MGADFTCGVLAIKRGKKPNFNAAGRLLVKITDDELTELVKQYSSEFDLNQVDEADILADISKARLVLETAWQAIKDGWNGEHRNFIRFTHAPLDAELLVTGDKTGGDAVPEINYMVLFEASGMAKAAGFLV